ncbi:MAG: GNAT family N-acetyltransferase [Mycoplasmatales bacterium]
MLIRDKKVIGLFLISLKTFLTIMFSNNTTSNEQKQLLDELENFEYQTGRWVNATRSLLVKNHQIRDEKAITYYATIKLNNTTNYFTDQCLQVRQLNLQDDEEIKSYTKAFNQFGEWGKFQFNPLNKNQKIYVYEIGGNIICGATISSISKQTGVIGNVFTLDAYRRHGYATKVLQKILEEHKDTERLLSLAYLNPVAEKLYFNLGFKSIGLITTFDKRND